MVLLKEGGWSGFVEDARQRILFEVRFTSQHA
jgi:hypothetical protein